MFQWFKDRWSEFEAYRTGRWSSWRKRHLEREPECQACRTVEELEVHHILPVHAGGPELAPPEGMITLCRECHFYLGHACDWSAWRPDVRHLAEVIRTAEVRRL